VKGEGEGVEEEVKVVTEEGVEEEGNTFKMVLSEILESSMW